MRIKKIIVATAYILRMVAFIMALPVTWMWFYRRNCVMTRRFCFFMCSHDIYRTLYAFIFASGICSVNLLYTMRTHDHSATMMTMAVSLPFLLDGVRHKLLVTLNRSKHTLFAFMLVALAAMATPHMYPLAVSLYLLIVASVFYPSRRAIENFQSYRGILFYHRYPALLLAAYYD